MAKLDFRLARLGIKLWGAKNVTGVGAEMGPRADDNPTTNVLSGFLGGAEDSSGSRAAENI